MDHLEKRIISVISQVCEIDDTSISSKNTFEELSLTSLDAVTISYELEQEFGIQIPDDQVYSITTVQELIDGVCQLIQVETANE